LEQVEASVCHSPINDYFHLPEEGKGTVNAEEMHPERRSVSHERLLVRSLWISMLDLEGGKDEVEDPKEVVGHQTAVLGQLNALRDWKKEANLNVDCKD